MNLPLCLDFVKSHPDTGIITGRLDGFTFHGGICHDDGWGVWWETPYINTPLGCTAAYLDRVKFTDELGVGHHWGYTDVLACHRCRRMGLKIAQLEAIYGHHPEHPAGNHPQLAAQWHPAFAERMDVISRGSCKLNSEGYPA